MPFTAIGLPRLRSIVSSISSTMDPLGAKAGTNRPSRVRDDARAHQAARLGTRW